MSAFFDMGSKVAFAAPFVPNRRPTPIEMAGKLAEIRARYRRRFSAPPRITNLRQAEARRLLRWRGLSDAEIDATMKDIWESDSIYDADKLGVHLNMTAAEKDALELKFIRPIDRTMEEEQALLRERKRKRDKARRAKRAAEKEISPRAKVIADALGDDFKSVAEIGASVRKAKVFKGLNADSLSRAIRRSLPELERLGRIEVAAEPQADRQLPRMLARLLPLERARVS